MSSGWTEADVEAIRSRAIRKSDLSPEAKRSKYGGVKTTIDGFEFDSKREAQRYQELKLQQQAGCIRKLRCHPHYTLCALTIDGAELGDVNAGAIVQRRQPVCEYIGDFEYEEPHPALAMHWRFVVEDVKSPATRLKEVYRLKRKLFEAQYNVPIREVR